MEFETKVASSKPVAKAKFNGKDYFVISKVKARHIVNIEEAYGSKIGDVQKGLRVLAQLLYEAMGEEGLTYEQLLDHNINDLEPLLELVK